MKTELQQILVNDFILLLKNFKLFSKIKCTLLKYMLQLEINFSISKICKLCGTWCCVTTFCRGTSYSTPKSKPTFSSFLHLHFQWKKFVIVSDIVFFFIKSCPILVLNAFFRQMATHSHNITSFQTNLMQYRVTRSCSNTMVCVNSAKVCLLTNNFHHLF